MSYILPAALLVGYISLVIFILTKFMDDENRLYLVALAVLVILGLAFVMDSIAKEEAQGPCIKEETSYQFNSGTKTMMPYTKCVERGTWIK